jgi:uncharacterized Rmd1/YagE family protein
MNQHKEQSRRKIKKFGIISVIIWLIKVNINRVQLKRLSAYCVAKEYDLTNLAKFLGERKVIF